MTGVLRTVLGNYPHTTPLKNGDISSASVHWDFHEMSPVHKAFAPMVRRDHRQLESARSGYR